MPQYNKLNQHFNCVHTLWFLEVQKDSLGVHNFPPKKTTLSD